MNESNSDWLNDTVPDNNEGKDNNVDNNENTNIDVDNNSNSDSSNEVVNEQLNSDDSNTNNEAINEQNDIVKEDSKNTKIDENQNVTEDVEKPIQNLSNQTLGSLMEKVEEEELSEDEKFLNEFIGPNAEKFSYKIISFPALFFTFLYMFYRKMYLLGLITFIAQLSILLFVNPYISIAINILSLIFFNSLYLSHCKRKIEKIKHSSGSKESGYMMNICSEKGGVNKGIPLIMFILGFAAVLFSILYLPVNKSFDSTKELIIEYAEEIGIDLNID